MKLKIPHWLVKYMKDKGEWDDNLHEELFPLPEYTGPTQIGSPEPRRDALARAEAILEDIADCAGSCRHEPCICKEVWEAINLIREARKCNPQTGS